MKFCRVLPVLVICFLLFSCSAEYFLQKGDRMYETGRLYKSCSYYKKAYLKIKSKDSKSVVSSKLGDAYEKINKLRDASLWYKKSLRYDESNVDVLYKMIEIAHKRGDVENIDDYLRQYQSLKGENPQVLKNYMDNYSNTNTKYKIEEFKKLNTAGNDFSPAYEVGDTNVVYFSSTRKVMKKKSFLSKIFSGKDKKDVVTGTPYSNVFKIEYTDRMKYKDKKGKEKIRQLKKSKWIKSVMLCDTSINSRFNEGTVCFSPDGEKMYYTSSRKINNTHSGTKIYQAEITNDGWGKIRMLNIVPDSVSVGHPAVSPDGSKLYFVSDMSHGYGGKDIWYCNKSGSNWTQPINAGKTINTEGDEMFPCFRDNGELYFSSDGHSGFGGLDIFKIKEKDGRKCVENMGYPFNSEADDFGIVYKNGINEGLFSSARGKRGVDNIYKFKYIPYRHSLKIKTENLVTGDMVPDVGIKMINERGEEKIICSGEDGMASLILDENQEYLFVLFKEGFLKDKIVINTKGLNGNNNFEKIVALKPIEKPIELPNILYDFGSWELKNESKKSLDNLVNVLNDNPNVVIELSSHTDLVGSESNNIKLSQKRAQSVVDYLIDKGIYWDRLVAKGYGESRPKEVSVKDVEKFDFLKQGQRLSPDYIASFDKEKSEYANQLNRRTEFRVLRTDYKPGPESKKNIGEENSKKKIEALLIKDLRTIKGMFFTLQIGEFNKNKIPDKFKILKVVFYCPVKGKPYCRITHGILDSYKQAKEYQKKVKSLGFDCTITVYKDGKRIELKEAIKLAKKSN